MPLLIFDDGAARLGPMTDLRAVFEVRTGMLTTAGRIAHTLGAPVAGYAVPAGLEAMVAARSDVPVNRLPDAPAVTLVNGRWARPDPGIDLAVGEAVTGAGPHEIVIARLSRADAESFLRDGAVPDRVRTRSLEPGADGPVLYTDPWDVLAHLGGALVHDIEHVRLLSTQVPGPQVTIVGSHPVTVHDTATVWPGVILDGEAGPIIVHDRAVIRPGAVLCGPCAIGRGATVIDGALIKAGTVIGPACKVGGEVGATIFQGSANKAHEGHLGDSWVGKWANFGAGTTSSNLLNTYGEIAMRVEPDGRRRRTGRTFLGAIVGDHVKLAIGTRLMTGTVLGTGAMIATTAAPPTTVGRFAWLTDAGEQRYRLDKFLDTARTVMARRDKTPSAEYVAAIEALYAGGAP